MIEVNSFLISYNQSYAHVLMLSDPLRTHVKVAQSKGGQPTEQRVALIMKEVNEKTSRESFEAALKERSVIFYPLQIPSPGQSKDGTIKVRAARDHFNFLISIGKKREICPKNQLEPTLIIIRRDGGDVVLDIKTISPSKDLSLITMEDDAYDLFLEGCKTGIIAKFQSEAPAVDISTVDTPTVDTPTVETPILDESKSNSASKSSSWCCW